MSKEASRKYRETHVESVREYDRNRYHANKKEIRERRKHHKIDKEREAKRRREYLKERDKDQWNEYHRNYYANSLDKDKKKQQRKNHRREDTLAVLISGAKRRAKKRGMEFNITKEDLHMPSVCPILGIPLSVGENGHHHGSPSIDRIDSTKGYVKGNVHIISWRANALKNNATIEELLAIALYMKELQHG